MASDKTDDRTPDEKERVARQAEALERLADDEWHARVMRDSVAAHNEWAGQAVNGLEIPRLQLMDAPGRSVVPVPVVAGQVVVHTSDPADHQEAVDALAAVGYRERSRSDAIVTFSGDPADLAKALEVMADKGIRGSANHFVALRGWTAKAGASPEHPTSRMQPHDPAKGDDESATPVAVVDTGVPEGVHSGPGGWLAHVEHGTSSVDRITMADVTVTAPPMLDPAAGHGAFALGMVRQAYPDVHLGSFRALTAVGGGSEVDVVEAIERAAGWIAAVSAANGWARPRGVLNLSFGTTTVDGNPPIAIEQALDALSPDILVVAAAGNVGNTEPKWPGASKRALGVAALAHDGVTPSTWSTRGSWVDFSTIGEGLVSTHVPGEENPRFDPQPETFGTDPLALWSGTSFAAPLIAGWLARRMAEDPSVPAQDAVTWLRGRGRRTRDFGYAIRRDDM